MLSTFNTGDMCINLFWVIDPTFLGEKNKADVHIINILNL